MRRVRSACFGCSHSDEAQRLLGATFVKKYCKQLSAERRGPRSSIADTDITYLVQYRTFHTIPHTIGPGAWGLGGLGAWAVQGRVRCGDSRAICAPAAIFCTAAQTGHSQRTLSHSVHIRYGMYHMVGYCTVHTTYRTYVVW